jgi:hypothetical protein
MTLSVKVLGTVMLLAAVGIALHQLCVQPYQCNKIKKRSEIHTARDFEDQDSVTAIRSARDTLAAISRCECACDIDIYMVRAANYRILNRLGDAEREYSAALRCDRRPEIYYNLGMVQLQLGKRDLAIDNLVTAVYFNPYIIGEVYPPEIYTEVHRIVWPDQGS